MRLAFVGKGGSGKSVLAGTTARLLARRGERVLALDSDPIPGLAISLGLGPLRDVMLAEAAEQDEQGRWRLKKGIGPARALQRYAAVGPDGVRLLQYGKAGPDGMRSVMGSLNAFYQLVHRLAGSNVLAAWSVVGDLPAGPRQTAFNWAPYTDTVVVVVEPTWQSILTARRIARIARSRAGVTVLPVANKVDGEPEAHALEDRLGEELFAFVPADPAVGRADRRGTAVIDEAPSSRAVSSIEGLVDKLERRSLAAMRT